jgi:hypothetical protein
MQKYKKRGTKTSKEKKRGKKIKIKIAHILTKIFHKR